MLYKNYSIRELKEIFNDEDKEIDKDFLSFLETIPEERTLKDLKHLFFTKDFLENYFLYHVLFLIEENHSNVKLDIESIVFEIYVKLNLESIKKTFIESLDKYSLKDFLYNDIALISDYILEDRPNVRNGLLYGIYIFKQYISTEERYTYFFNLIVSTTFFYHSTDLMSTSKDREYIKQMFNKYMQFIDFKEENK